MEILGHETSKLFLKRENMTSRQNLRPLKFHQIHGNNIILSKEETAAYRSNSFNHGIVFTNRPVNVLESVLLRINKTETYHWCGALRIGFTINDPKTMKSKVPAVSCPDLVNISGNWAKAIPEFASDTDCLLSFHVNANGYVYYSIDNFKKRFLFSGVNTTKQLWGIVDVYGNTTEVELIGAYLSDLKEQLYVSNVTFNQVHGRTVTLQDNRTVALRKTSSSSNVSYVFSDGPMILNEKIAIEVFEVDLTNTVFLEYGVTSCDPSNLNPTYLPADTEDLLDFPDYWVVKSDPCHYEPKDIIIFCTTSLGQFTVMKNGTSVSSTLSIDVSQPLWLFLKLSGCISSVCIKTSSTSDYVDIMRSVDISIPSGKSQDNGEKYKDRNTNAVGKHSSSDCVICCKNKVDCTLYRCGHMCMCYECARSLWYPRASFRCPICRNTIRDIIKVYMHGLPPI